jgi:signal transduction histidine kinase
MPNTKMLERPGCAMHHVVDSAPVPMLVFDSGENIVYANPRAEGLFGKQLAELLATDCSSFFSCPPPYTFQSGPGCPGCTLFEAVQSALSSGGCGEGEFWLSRNSGGDSLWLRFAVSPVEIDGSSSAVAVVEDITERKRKEKRQSHVMRVLQALRSVNQLIAGEKDPLRLIKRACRALTDSLGYYSAWIALLNEQGDAVTATANSNFSTSFSRLRERLLIGQFPDCMERCLRQDSLWVTRSPPEECVNCPVAAGHAGRAGMAAPLSFRGRTYGVICASVPVAYADDHEEKALFHELAGDIGFGLNNLEEAALRREREAEVSTIFESVPVLMILMDQAGSIVRANRKVLEYTNRTAGETVGLRAGEALRCIHALDDPGGCGLGPACQDCLVRRASMDTLATGTPYDQVEARLSLFRGDTVANLYLLVSTSLVQGFVGPMAIVCIEDITGQKKAEKERAILQDQFHQAQKLESIGRLAGGIAHDLNNVLTPILGYGELLLESTGVNDPRAEALGEIVSAGRRAREMVGQLLAFSRKQMLEIKTIHINSLLRNFEKLLRRTIREDIAIILLPAKELPSVRGDAGQLEQVAMNLAVNAQDAMPEGGKLTIETGRAVLEEADVAGSEGMKPGVYVVMAFTDTGIGIDEKTKAHLFEPFFTTKGKEKGTGLGLATAYGIVKQHGGDIRFQSEPGSGTAFRIYLPASTEHSQEVERELPAPPVSGGTESILVAEDNKHVMDLTLTILRRFGYEVLAAQNGHEAIALLKRQTRPVRLLLTDVIMPDMNGKQLYEALLQFHPNMKVLYMSGYTENVIAQQGVVDQDVKFINKPFSVNTLAAKVRSILDE